jgi:hypothetical protein
VNVSGGGCLTVLTIIKWRRVKASGGGWRQVKVSDASEGEWMRVKVSEGEWMRVEVSEGESRSMPDSLKDHQVQGSESGWR